MARGGKYGFGGVRKHGVKMSDDRTMLGGQLVTADENGSLEPVGTYSEPSGRSVKSEGRK